MIYFKSFTMSLIYCCFYLPFAVVAFLHRRSASKGWYNWGFSRARPLYTRLGYCFSFLRCVTPIFDVYFITPLNAERRLPKFERNKFILALCEEANINYLILWIVECFDKIIFVEKSHFVRAKNALYLESRPPSPSPRRTSPAPPPSRGVGGKGSWHLHHKSQR